MVLCDLKLHRDQNAKVWGMVLVENGSVFSFHHKNYNYGRNHISWSSIFSFLQNDLVLPVG